MADDDTDLLAEIADLRVRVARVQAATKYQKEANATFDAGLVALAEQITELSERLGATDPDFVLSPWWWPRMTQSEAREAWDLLTAWVDDVLIGRYDNYQTEPLSFGTLPRGQHIVECWFAHPVIVDQLSALHWSWRGAYRRSAQPNGPVDWQTNWLTKVLGTIKTELRGTECFKTCPVLGRTVTLKDRMAWIKDDVAARPTERS